MPADIADALVSAMSMSKVSLICNAGLPFNALRERIGNDFRVAFVLETLEHVGSLPSEGVRPSRLQSNIRLRLTSLPRKSANVTILPC
jgi:hypothetical protein